MKKRILCLLLGLLMLVMCFTGCSTQTDDEAVEDITEEASQSAITLSMYLMSENNISDEQKTAIEQAVNSITKMKFKIQLKLYYYTAEEYYKELEASFAARAEAEAAGNVTTYDEEAEDVYVENEWGVSEIKYPTIDGYQVDIFYMGGYEKFAEYLEMGMLSNLNEEITSSSKKLSSYISTPYLSYMKSTNNKAIYAVPTNAAIGEYTYLLLNKNALEKTHYNTDAGIELIEESGLYGDELQKYLGLAKEGGYNDILYSELDYVDLASMGLHYWGIDENGNLCTDFSAIASVVEDGAKYADVSSYLGNMTSVLNTKFTNQLQTVCEYVDGGYFADADAFENGNVAAACIKGGADVLDKYGDDYEVVVLEYPTISSVDLYNNMFAVTTYTSSLSRSMEIVTYLNTNEEFRNLLLYGIEGENYELVDSEYTDAEGNPYQVVKRLNENYMMDVNKTANTLIARSLVGEDPTQKEYIKTQNLDYVVSLTMGFNLTYSGYEANIEDLKELRKLSETVKAEIIKGIEDGKYKVQSETPSEVEYTVEVSGVIQDLKNQILTNTYYKNVIATTEPAEGETVCSLRYLYEQWATAMKIVPVEEDGDDLG